MLLLLYFIVSATYFHNNFAIKNIKNNTPSLTNLSQKLVDMAMANALVKSATIAIE